MNPMPDREDENVMEVDHEELKNAETEEETVLSRFSELQIIDSNLEPTMSSKEKQKLESYSFYKREKESMTTKLGIWKNRSHSQQEIETRSRKGKEKIECSWDSELEPELANLDSLLKLISEIISGLGYYGEKMIQMARNRVENDENLIAHFEAGAKMFKKLNEKLRVVNYTTRWMRKKMKKTAEEDLYGKIHEIMSGLEGIYEVYLGNNSPEIGFVLLQWNCTEFELQRCEIQLKQCGVHLDELTWRLGMLHAKYNLHFF